ncbi:MAG: S41 family peptidase [Dysgonamonadaceae bacterium]|jgi:carboxyl-terminal processing protease|nr:S41 family peptidase [Dysgonamonadaceae bacterium]
MKKIFLLSILLLNLNACSKGQNVFRYPEYIGITIPDETRMEFVKLNMALANIMNAYVDTLNTKKTVEDAIVGMLEKLDPHSNYLTPEEVREMNEPLQGNFDGIGVQFNMLTDTLNVVQVIPGGPSEKVGITVGDKIMFINDTLVAGVKLKNTDIMAKLRGKKGTTVNVKIQRNKNPELLTFSIVRDKIPIYSIDAAYMIDKETGYIKINRFAATTYDEFIKAINKLKTNGMNNLILDLQGNGGGYLGTAIQIANEFLKRGSLIVYTEGVHQPREDQNASANGQFEKGRLVLIVDESSASASEIVSGAIQDWDRGVIVGRRTFGKGLVQRPLMLPDGSMIRLTVARYYTPTGRSIQKHYENGNTDAYNHDLINRYNYGELLSADSIHFPDSLKYNTLLNKRTVYGGGGIMPDRFVPIDTTFNTRLMRELSGYGIVYKFVQHYLDDHRKVFQSNFSDFDTYNAKFSVTDELMSDLIDYYRHDRANAVKDASDTDTTKQEGLTDEQIRTDLERSEGVIRAQIKSLFARNLFGESEYYQIINNRINAYTEAIRIINNEKDYKKLLSE